MSMDKWISDNGSKEERIKRERAFKNLSEGEVNELKKKKIREITKKDKQTRVKSSDNDNIINEVLKFKEWINQRTYLKGDKDKIEMWIRNLYLKIQEDRAKKKDLSDKKKIIEEYNKIPPNFLDEKIRVAINKRIRGRKRTNSDNYYLRKLKKTVQEKLNESKYYEILEKLMKL